MAELVLGPPRRRPSPGDAGVPRGDRRPLRVLLVCMPWASLDMPSLGLSVLVPVVRDADAVGDLDVVYANLRWAEHVYVSTDKEIGSRHYEEVVNGYYVATGEWIFSSALYGRTEPEATAFYQAASRSGADLAAAATMFRLAPDFVDDLAREIGAGGYDVLGLTSTFDQNMPSLALAKAVKAVDPGIVTVLGGANCDDVQGVAIARNFPFVDYAVRGEGELVFPELLGAIADDDRSRLATISGLCWRDGDGRVVANPTTSRAGARRRHPRAGVRRVLRTSSGVPRSATTCRRRSSSRAAVGAGGERSTTARSAA